MNEGSTHPSAGAASGGAPIVLVATDQTDERTAERLRRAGLSVETVAPSALLGSLPGTLYLAVAERVTDEAVRTTVMHGAHLCLLPPWPPTSAGLLGRGITIVSATDRSGVTLDSTLTRGMGAASPGRPLRILFREQLLGVLGQPLATTTSGEVVLAALPRTSNHQGQVLATTLLLGTPSAQTSLADVAALLGVLLAWLGRVPVDHSPVGVAATPEDEGDAVDGERWAQVALLALALTLPEMAAGETTIAVGPDSSTSIRATFSKVARRLGQPAADGEFAAGWQILANLGVLSAESTSVSPTVLRHYLGQWQLMAHLRRLRQPAIGR